jgi:hypothetical protein
VLTCLLRQARLWQQGLLLAAVFLALVNQPARDLYDHRFVNQRQFRHQAQALEARLPVAGKRLATRHGAWHQGLFLSFFTRSRFYGATPAGVTGKALYQSLRRHHIDYYLVWGEPPLQRDHLVPVVRLPDQELTVYRVR